MLNWRRQSMNTSTTKPSKPKASPNPLRLASPANLLTYVRIGLTVAMAVAFFVAGGRVWAFAAFTLAALTDILDGHVARARRELTSFGRMLDPIADKILVAAAILILVSDGTIAGLAIAPALIILSREILVSGLREHLAEFRVPLPASRLAKIKTGIQMVALAALLAAPVFTLWQISVHDAGLACLWLAALITLYTGFTYFRAGLRHFVADKGSE